MERHSLISLGILCKIRPPLYKSEFTFSRVECSRGTCNAFPFCTFSGEGFILENSHRNCEIKLFTDLNGQYPGPDILLVSSCACKNRCCYSLLKQMFLKVSRKNRINFNWWYHHPNKTFCAIGLWTKNIFTFFLRTNILRNRQFQKIIDNLVNNLVKQLVSLIN